MVVIGGCIFVVVAVLVGFSMAGGHIAALCHASEFVTIGGASLGALIVMSPLKVMRDLVRVLFQLVKGSPYDKKAYGELFALLYALARKARKDGVLTLESHISDPHTSDLFQKYPRISKNHHATEFLCNGLSLLLDGKIEEDHQVTSALEEERK